MRNIVTTVLGAMLALAGPAIAQTSPVVVELYTSQGCASCPPADAFFATLAERKDVIALALHVDYWDYIGWEDSFAAPDFTSRQKSYARAAGSKSIYTPQLVVGGQDHVIGNKPDELARLVRKHAARGGGVTLVLSRENGALRVTASAQPPVGRDVQVQLIRYIPEATVAIERGENAGRTITYHNVVSSWIKAGVWDGTSPYAALLEISGDKPVVVILQTFDPNGPREILAAARLP